MSCFDLRLNFEAHGSRTCRHFGSILLKYFIFTLVLIPFYFQWLRPLIHACHQKLQNPIKLNGFHFVSTLKNISEASPTPLYESLTMSNRATFVPSSYSTRFAHHYFPIFHALQCITQNSSSATAISNGYHAPGCAVHSSAPFSLMAAELPIVPSNSVTTPPLAYGAHRNNLHSEHWHYVQYGPTLPPPTFRGWYQTIGTHQFLNSTSHLTNTTLPHSTTVG